MQETKKRLFALALALWALSSCSQDASDVQGSATGGETVTFSLNAEVSVDDEQTRAINYKLGNNAQGQLVPLPQFTDGQEVEVHTILKSSRGAYAIKTLKWRYDANKDKLVLSPNDGHSITVSGFNNDSGTKWYISGLIGGRLNGTKVAFEGNRVLSGVEGNLDDAVGSFDVPYAFAWTELTIDTQNPANIRESNGSYKYAQVPPTADLKFSPQGALIGYKLGNDQKAGAYTFTPSGFTVNTNAFGDQGTFELNTATPTASAPVALFPAWTEGTPTSLVYRFADGQEPGEIAHKTSASRTYYAWVMPHKTQPTEVSTRVVIKGESSRPETGGFRNYTKLWFTDYSTKASKVTQGKVHTLRANATHTYLLPIEYVTDYNLAGGEGLTYTIAPGISPGYLGEVSPSGVQPAGITGDLRFATSHRNDQSGYYNWYKVMGLYDADYNPHTKNLQTEVDNTFGAGKYFLPISAQWRGVFPAINSVGSSSIQRLNVEETMAFGPGHDLISQSYYSDYSRAFSANENESDVVVYAIRFKARPIASAFVFQDNSLGKSDIFPSAPDNSLKCAYRFTRVGGHATWYNSRNYILWTHGVIDVVYLGDEAVPTSLDAISNAQWWEDKKSQGLVISKTFSAPGVVGVPPGGSLVALVTVVMLVCIGHILHFVIASKLTLTVSLGLLVQRLLVSQFAFFSVNTNNMLYLDSFSGFNVNVKMNIDIM